MENQIIGSAAEELSEELGLINAYTLKTLGADEVFTFTVTLCDNETDRDFDRFSTEALKGLAPMFVGKSGIFDHSMKAKDQTARVFKTWVETDPVRLNRQGEPYAALKAKAYCLRTPSNADFIAQVEGGISKEVSVSCSVARSECTVCGKNTREEACGHIKGRYYRKSGKKVLCCNILSEPFDAYEWSFVAVPAQKAAGVTKSFSGEQSKEAVKTSDDAASFEEEYRNELYREIKRFAAVSSPGNAVVGETLLSAMSIDELKTCRHEMKKAAEKSFTGSQLAAKRSLKQGSENEYFKI